MAKDKTGAALRTPDLYRRKPGRPASGEKPMTGAERVAKLRAERKAAGLCPCCGK